MSRFHRGGRKFDATADFLTQAARNVPAHQSADRLADGPVTDAFFDVSVFRVEPLRIADGEFELAGAGDGNKFVRFFEFERDWFFKKHVLAGSEKIPGHRKVCRLGRRTDKNSGNLLVLQQGMIIAGGRFGADRARNLPQPLGTILGDVDASHQRIGGTGLGANTTAPTGANDGHVDLIHLCSPTRFLLNFCLRGRAAHSAASLMSRGGPPTAARFAAAGAIAFHSSVLRNAKRTVPLSCFHQ